MPPTDPDPSPRLPMLQQVRRIMKWIALLSIAIAVIAVVLVMRGDEGAHPYLLIATALGAAVTVLLGTGVMIFTFLSSSSGQDTREGRNLSEDKTNDQS